MEIFLNLYWNSVFSMLIANCQVAWQHGSDWSDCLGSLDFKVYPLKSLHPCFVKNELVALNSLCCSHYASTSGCRPMEYRKDIGRSPKRRDAAQNDLPYSHDDSTKVPIKQDMLYLNGKSTLTKCHLGMCSWGAEAESISWTMYSSSPL